MLGEEQRQAFTAAFLIIDPRQEPPALVLAGHEALGDLGDQKGAQLVGVVGVGIQPDRAGIVRPAVQARDIDRNRRRPVGRNPCEPPRHDAEVRFGSVDQRLGAARL